MVTGAHILLYSEKAEEDRRFFSEVLEFKSVDAGHGWLIFKLPPAELAVHPADGEIGAELYLMCTDLAATIEKLHRKSAACTAVTKERWGMRTTVTLPSGKKIGLYQPMHPTALELK